MRARTRINKTEKRALDSLLVKMNLMAIHFEDHDIQMSTGSVESHLNYAISIIEDILAETAK